MAANKKRTKKTKKKPVISSMRKGHGLGVVRQIEDFRTHINAQSALSNQNRARLVDQAEILIGDLYTHLPLKRAMHAVDPVQRLRLLKQRMSGLSILRFQAELLEIFKSLRDLHTNYSLPAPFGRQIAFLGILVERYFDNGQSRWMVSKVADHLIADPNLTPGVEVTHWNGMPMELAVWRNADKEAGSNPAAQLARGLETLTLRFLRSSLPPDEDWVAITYEKNGATHETKLAWQVFDNIGDLQAGAADPQGLIQDLIVPLRYNVGLDERGEALRRARKMIFNRDAVKEQRRTKRIKGVPRATKALQTANILPTARPDEITPRIITTPNGTFGYIRLWTFHMEDQNINAFINEFIRLITVEMPSNGLILDVRGNGGGYIIAAEFLLQLITPVRITPEPTQFLATPETLALCKADPNLADWRPSLETAVSTGALYSAGIPLSPEHVVNDVGQLYFGPVVLVTDAYCYSACDMFAAGFQDHDIGTILGVDERTGAGGANVMTHSAIRNSWNGGPLEALPAGAQMRVSFRRTLRVGPRAGEPVEDLGVTRDQTHEMTKDDLLNGNRDLINRAGQILAQGTPREFDVGISSQGATATVAINALNVSSTDIYVNERPVVSGVSLTNGSNTIPINNPSQGSTVLLEGFHNGRFVAARRIQV